MNRKGVDVDVKNYLRRRNVRCKDDIKIKFFFEKVRKGEKIIVNVIDLI